jgi:hypothetical protein
VSDYGVDQRGSISGRRSDFALRHNVQTWNEMYQPRLLRYRK